GGSWTSGDRERGNRVNGSLASGVAAATAHQRRALEPAESVWVAASAGTGKTKVLTDRLLALMLGGTDPAHLLCLTFTRAAAAEMANRINQRLAAWTTLPPGRLEEALAEATETVIAAARADSGGRGGLAAALAIVAGYAPEERFIALMTALATERGKLRQALDGGDPALHRRLCTALAVPEAATRDS